MRALFVTVLLGCGLGLAGCAGKHRPQPWPAAPSPGLPPQAPIFSAVERETCVLFVGPVRHRVVPWFDGLTLAQSIVAAGYLSAADPRVIRLTRAGETVEISPDALLGGGDFQVMAGDLVEIIP